MRFGEVLRLELEKRDLKQKVFSEMINVSPSTVCGYINTNRQPDFELVKRIASALNVSIDYLLDYNIQPENAPLSKKEQLLLDNLRALDKEKQEIIFKLTDMLSQK